MRVVRITDHAIQRFQERVDAGASRAEARLALQQLVGLGKSRATPRHWMSETTAAPGKRFVYWVGRPGVCAVVTGSVVVTVITRELVSTSGRRHLHVLSPKSKPALRVVEPRWRWDGEVDAA